MRDDSGMTNNGEIEAKMGHCKAGKPQGLLNLIGKHMIESSRAFDVP